MVSTFDVVTDSSVYQISFCHLQINITSRCNMRCKHCRGSYCGAKDLSLGDINTILDFADEYVQEGASFLISGGEPLLHPKFKEIMYLLKSRGVELVAITTNGTYVTKEILDYLTGLNFKRLRMSISLDGLDAAKVNEFRQCKTAYQDAVNAIYLVASQTGIECIVRTTIQKNQLRAIPQIVDFVSKSGADCFSISSIIPAGRARDNKGLCFDAESKRKLLDIINNLSKDYPLLKMDVNDPLRCLIKTNKVYPKGTFGGCIAGIGSFSVEPDGTLLPCPLMHGQVITNIKGKTGYEILENYKKSSIIHTLLEKNLKGKCGGCKHKYVCGGCRARADGVFGDYMETDPECFMQVG